MSPALLGLVLSAALFHASWNAVARHHAGHLAVLWLGALLAWIAITPVAVVLLWQSTAPLPTTALVCMLATGIIHVLYFLALSSAYQRGEISLVYPVARGSGVALTALGGAWLLDEELSRTGLVGIAAVSIGILLFAVPGWTTRGRGLRQALAVGATIPAYSLVDKVGTSLVHPIVYIWAMYGISCLGLTLFVFGRFRGQIRAIARQRARGIALIGLGSMLTYLIILFAYRMGPVGYIVAARESSVLFGALFGVLFLKERLTAWRATALAVVLVGLVCLRLA
ncbi:MAG: DMT family transporter [bacterium]|nr:DMT family transporter [bacterium]